MKNSSPEKVVERKQNILQKKLAKFLKFKSLDRPE